MPPINTDPRNPILSAANASSGLVDWQGGEGLFTVEGTFGGATVSLQYLGPDGVTMIAVGASTTVTAAASVLFTLPRAAIQVAITGGSGVSITSSVRTAQQG